MDKSWILLPRNSPAYQEGLKGFLDFAFERSSVDGKILCPCALCNFRKWLTRDVVYEHLIIKQFPRNYTFWFDHGESHEVETENNSTANVSSLGPNIVNDEDPIRNMVNEDFGVDMHRDNEPNEDVAQGEGPMPNVGPQGNQAREFYELAKDGEQPLYEGCTRPILRRTLLTGASRRSLIHSGPNLLQGKNELETKTGRQYSRLEMYTIAHKRKDRSFVNEDARQQIEQLESEVEKNASEQDAFTTVIGKEHHGHVRGMGFGVCPSKVFKGVGSTSANGSSAQVNKLQLELETERARVDTLVQEVERFKGLEEQLAIVMQHLAGQGFNRVTDLGSPNEPSRSSSASHDPGNK